MSETKRDALLFIHGYNTSFNDGCRRAAQLAYDLKFPGTVLLYSWPSKNHWYAYAADEEIAAWSSPHFEAFLRDILAVQNLLKLHVISHGMGNRVVLSGLTGKSITPEK